MNKKEEQYFSNLEKKIKENINIQKIRDLPNFPYQTIEEIKQAYLERKIDIAAPYNSERISIYGTKKEIIIHYTWLTLPILIIITDILLAIISKEWILLAGVLLVIIGFMSSSPYFPLKNTLSGLGGLLFLVSLFLFSWPWSVIIGSFLFAQIFAIAAREHYSMVLINRAFNSEILFCWMYLYRLFLIRNFKFPFIQLSNFQFFIF